MLKEYRFRLNYEYYPFKDEYKKDYYVNGHKIDAALYYTLFDRVSSGMPLDTSNVFLWKNHKTGSRIRTECLTFNEDMYY